MVRTRGTLARENHGESPTVHVLGESTEKNANTTNIIPDNTENNENSFSFQGVEYKSYDEYVQAKRNRNRDMLAKSGLLDAVENIRQKPANDSLKKRGLTVRKRERTKDVTYSQRKSRRIAGSKSDGLYIIDDKLAKKRSSNNSVVVGREGGTTEFVGGDLHIVEEKRVSHFKGRINDGSPLSLEDSVDLCDGRFRNDVSVASAKEFTQNLRQISAKDTFNQHCDALASQVRDMSLDVAKVVPERIYSTAFHPHSLIACAGDKSGHIGFWNIESDSANSENADVHLFRPHSRPVVNIEWTKDGSKLYTTSMDGTVRQFDVSKSIFTEAFATYDDDEEFKGLPGYGIDEGYNFWVQYSCVDHRNENCLFLSTSKGSIIHLDLRSKNQVTFDHYFSESKINTVSLHKNGFHLASCGLDRTVKLWDTRKIESKEKNKELSSIQYNKSINSAFFSPNGQHLLTTSMDDKIDIFTNIHMKTSTSTVNKPSTRIHHCNQTGRWLSTFMAQWHPTSKEDLFVVGSMKQPRRMEIYDANSSDNKPIGDIEGDALTAVASRCSFHPNEHELIVVGGNSSGRVTVARQGS